MCACGGRPRAWGPAQVGVWYSPRVELVLFDAAVVGDTGGTIFVPWREACAAIAAHGGAAGPLLHAEPLFVGPWARCLDFDYCFPTTIPRRLKLPELGARTPEASLLGRPTSAAPCALKHVPVPRLGTAANGS